MDNQIVGIDEVGRGCLAGPLVVGAVMLTSPVPGLRDSKVLSKKVRQVLSDKILKNAYVGLGWVWPEEIDTLGLSSAMRTGVERAMADFGSAPYKKIIIDGNVNYLKDEPKAECLVKADATIAEVSAARVVAKVARDTYMQKQAVQYPDYGFEANVGYGTKTHFAALNTHGLTAIHRKSFEPMKSMQ
jgi:ribonuclease HII